MLLQRRIRNEPRLTGWVKLEVEIPFTYSRHLSYPASSKANVKSVDSHSNGDQSAKAGNISIADEKVTTLGVIETRTCMQV